MIRVGNVRCWCVAAAAVSMCIGTAQWTTAAPPAGFRALAPGTLTVIPADAAADDTVQRVDLPEITVARADMAWTPKRSPAFTTLVERAKARDALLDIWCLEFAFKLPRLIDVEVPALDAASGDVKMQIKQCWYLVYRVKNVGWRRTVIDAADPTKRIVERFEKPIRFIPHFVLESLEGLSADEGLTSYRAYLDRIVPGAMEPIREREDPARRFLDSAAMAEEEIAPGEERWGVAVWEDVDPRIDFFSVYVQGLTNATRWRPVKEGDASGRSTEETLESLRLDFWRPGDARDQVDEEMSLGYAGIFEQMTLGDSIMEVVSRPSVVKSDPVAGLEMLKIDWDDLMEPAAGANARLAPLAKVIAALAGMPAAERSAAARAMFGDLGDSYLAELAAALPKEEGTDPLQALATMIGQMAEQAGLAARRRMAVERFGAAAPRIDWLANEAAVARQVAALDEARVSRQALAKPGPLGAFDAVRQAIVELPDAADRERLLAGLFGPRGPRLYAAATEAHEGIDHAWVFRYEVEDSPQ